MSEIIPVVHCFDQRFCLPAAVSFSSMLRTASRDYFYALYVIHSDIPIEQQQRLMQVVDAFPNASLQFLDTPDSLDDLFEKAGRKAHYSKEMFLKFFVPELLPQHDRVIVTDVDVVWLDGIENVWEASDGLGSDYLAGVRPIAPLADTWLRSYWKRYERDFTLAEISRLATGAGLWVFNLDEMRKDETPARFLKSAHENAWRLRQPEQDVVNLVCYPRIQFLPLRSMVPTYVYAIYGSGDALSAGDQTYSRDEVEAALARPIQLHYAGPRKPWLFPEAFGADHWLKALVDTEFVEDWLVDVGRRFADDAGVRSRSFPLPLARGRRLRVSLLPPTTT